MKRLIICIITLLTLCKGYVHAVEPPVTFSDARVLGMGNTFVAIADDKNMLFFNPAGFATYGLMKTSILEAVNDPAMWRPRYQNIGDLTIASVTVDPGSLSMALSLAGADADEIFDVLYFFPKLVGGESPSDSPMVKLANMDFFDKFSDGTLTTAEATKANNYLIELYSEAIKGVINVELLSYARHYFGFGFFWSTDAAIQLDPTQGPFNLPNIQAKIYSDIVFPIGIGIPVPNHKKWSAGVTLKYFHRIKVEINNISDFVEFYNWMSGGYFNENMDDYFDSHSLMDIVLHGVEYTEVPIKQFKAGTGYGFDLGLMYRPAFAWKFGLLLSDVYTKINWWDKSEPSRIPINLKVGSAFTPRWSFLGLFSNPILALDVEDVFHQQEKNFFLKWHFGSELKFLFEFFSLRFGINEGYPSYGMGIDLGVHFFSKLPIFKLLRPNRIYFPKFNPKDREFAQKNPLCCCLTGLLAPIFYAHVKVDLSYTGYELGSVPGQIMSYQLLTRVSLSYSY